MGCRNTEGVITVPAALAECQHLITVLSSILGYRQGGNKVESSGLELSHMIKFPPINFMSAGLQ